MKHLLSILLLSIILAACSSDPIAPPATDGTPIKLSLRIATQSKDTQSKDAQSKASASPALGWNYEQGDELIEDWVVIMVNDADHTIEQVFTPATSPNNVETDNVTTNLRTTASNKTFYSFANISLAQLEQATRHTFAKGGTMPDIASATWHIDGNGFNPKAKDATTGRAQGIPMTGICHMSLTNKDNETTKTLYVVRMLAKLQFNITNKTGDKITLNTISIDSISANPASSSVQNVMLFPSATPTDANTQVVQQPRLNGTQPQQVYTLALNKTVANDASIAQTLYVNECTTPANTFGQFMLTVRLTMADGTTTQQRYSVVSNDNGNWHFIARNDWRIIPSSCKTSSSTSYRSTFLPLACCLARSRRPTVHSPAPSTPAASSASPPKSHVLTMVRPCPMPTGNSAASAPTPTLPHRRPASMPRPPHGSPVAATSPAPLAPPLARPTTHFTSPTTPRGAPLCAVCASCVHNNHCINHYDKASHHTSVITIVVIIPHRHSTLLERDGRGRCQRGTCLPQQCGIWLYSRN